MGKIYESQGIKTTEGSGSGGQGTVTSVDNVFPQPGGNVELNAYTPDNPPPPTEFEVGEVTSLPAGSPATVEFVDSPDGKQVVNFGIPEGNPGADGKDGSPGPANVLTIGDVTTLAPGSAATAEITGTSPNQVLNLGIPQGEPGGGGGGSTIPALGEPGASGFFMLKDNTADALLPGDTVDGSAIWYAGVSNGTSAVASYSIAPFGTWEARGYVGSLTPSVSRASLFTRIDQVAATQENIDAIQAGTKTRNFRFANPEQTLVNCELFFSNAWHPFTASSEDKTWWGKMIYEMATSGAYGAVADYQE